MEIYIFRDYESHSVWMGSPFPLDLSRLPVLLGHVPLQHPILSKYVTPIGLLFLNILQNLDTHDLSLTLSLKTVIESVKLSSRF